MNALSYLQPENPVAKGIVIILLILFVIWLALLVYGGFRLRAQERQMDRCAEVESLVQAWRALITSGGSSGGSVRRVAPTPEDEALARELAFTEFCKVKAIEEDSVVARHLKSIFEAGCKESRLEIGELIKHTTNELFRGNGFLRSVLATFIIFGLLGSLFGLADSLSHLMPGAGIQSNEQLSQNLADLLGKLKSAFAPSIWGILLTISGVILFTLYLQLLCSPVRNLLERMTLNIWVPRLFPTVTQRLQETLLHSERQMARSVEAARKVAEFAESIQQEGGELKRNLEGANETLKLVTRSADGIGNFTSKFAESVTALTGFQRELHKLYESIGQESKAFQASVKTNIEKAEVFYENARKTIDDQHQQLKAALKGLAGYEKAYIESRWQLDAKIGEVLDQAKKAYADIGERNRELVEAVGNPLREELKNSLNGVGNTLTVQLQGIQNQFTRFDAPITRAAETIEGSLETMVKRTDALTKEMQREIIGLEERHLEQTTHLGSINQQIGSLLTELNNTRKLQSEQIQTWSQAMNALAQSLSMLSSSMMELGQSAKLSGQGLPQLDRFDEQNKQMIAALNMLSRQSQSQSEQVRLLFSEVRKEVGSLNDSVRSAGRTVRSKVEVAPVLYDDKRYNASPGPDEKEKNRVYVKERPSGWKRLRDAVWPWGK